MKIDKDKVEIEAKSITMMIIERAIPLQFKDSSKFKPQHKTQTKDNEQKETDEPRLIQEKQKTAYVTRIF
jgi:hypothetical protein